MKILQVRNFSPCLAWASVFVATTTFPLHAQSPPNDLFENRVILGNGSTSANGTNAGATAQAGEPINPSAAGRKTVWWSWTPAFSGTVSIDTAGSSYDTTLAIYTGSALANLVLIEANDDDADIGMQSRVSFAVNAGTSYQIQVDGYNGATGFIRLNYPNPASQGVAPLINFHPVSATVNPGDPINLFVGAQNAGSYQWYFNNAAIGNATASSYTIAAADFPDAGAYRCVVTNAFGLATSNEATIVVEVPQPAPPNDNFANAAGLVGNSTQTTGTNVSSTGEPGEPNHGGVSDSGSGLRSVWWTWTAPEDGRLTLDTFGSALDTVLAVYTGGSLESLVPIAANDQAGDGSNASRGALTVTGGTVYRIAVAGYFSYTGPFNLNLSFAPGVPVLNASPLALNGLATSVGSPSAAPGIALSAENFTDTLLASASAGFEVSTDNSTFSSSVSIQPADGLVSTTIYIRIASGSFVGPVSGTLTLGSPGLPGLIIPLSGRVDSGYADGYSAGFAEGVASITGNATNAALYGLHSTEAIMDMNLGGLMIQGTGGGNATLYLQLQSTPNLSTQPFQNDGEPIAVPVQMGGSKGFLRIRALGPNPSPSPSPQ